MALCLGVGVLGALVTESSVESWYAQIAKPVWTPPDWVFAPVWTLLYVLMAIAGWMVWRSPSCARRRTALLLFALQLALNGLWSQLFFGLHAPGLALVDIALLWIAIVATIAVFRRVRPAAAWLLSPYLLWVSFAAALNATIWWRN